MRILVITDTHNHIEGAERILRRDKTITDVIHLGDMLADAINLQRLFPNVNVRFVLGNNDYNRNVREDIFLEECGFKIFATHGHKYSVKMGLLRLGLHAKELGANVVLFGHTHVPCDTDYDGMRMINPSPWGYAIIDENGIEVNKFDSGN